MITGVEIDMVVTNCLSALNLYEEVFGAKKIEATSYQEGLNEAVFTIYGTRFHLLDENSEFSLNAPKEGVLPLWCNVSVEDIVSTFEKAKAAGFTVIQPLNDMQELGVINAIVKDPFGYVWMLHQVVKEVSFEERCKIMEAHMGITR
ncbi:MAG: VOC family protein [Treponema sp.]|jgi:uncharacterized glyoxalase superfamily protein PhnB|nr:VOC family protein [Treponema sp.]